MSITHRMRYYEKVYSYRRQREGKQPNGRIVRTWQEDGEIQEVLVEWLSSPAEHEMLDYDVFFGCYTRDFGGTWYIDA